MIHVLTTTNSVEGSWKLGKTVLTAANAVESLWSCESDNCKTCKSPACRGLASQF